MAYSPDHSLTPASGAPPAAPSAAPSGAPPAVPSGPPWPNPLASIAYASCRPADMDPPAEDSALTSRAAYERLNRAAARAETLVLYRLDMLAGCRDSLDVDQTRLERSIQNLWRLTAVRKTLMSIEAALNSPTPAPQGAAPGVDLQSALAEVNRLLAEVPIESTAPSATAPADQPAPASPESPLPVVLSPSPSQSQSRSESQSTPSMGSTGSMGSIPSIESIPPVAPSPARPIAPSSLSIGSVPACPCLSLSSAARTLDRVNADMANYTEYVTTAADYDSNVTAEEFLRPSHTLKAHPAPAAEDEEAILLADPALSPSLKSQISTRNSSPSLIRNPSEQAQWAFETAVRNPINPDSCLLTPDSSIPHSTFRIPPSPHPSG